MGPRRRMGRGLVGSMARTAVVAGTASAVAGSVQHRQQQKYAQADMAQQAELNAAVQQAAPAPMDTNAQFAEIEKLGDLMQKGLITQEEFDAKKRLILGL